MPLSEIADDIQSIEENSILNEEENFNQRADAIDFLEFHVIDRIEGLRQNKLTTNQLDDLMLRAEKLKLKLENTDNVFFARLRDHIAQGIYKGAAFTQMLNKYTGFKDGDNSAAQKKGYDNLDTFLNGFLYNQPLPEATMERTSEMVFYQQTPARIVLQLAERANLKEDDVFFDIGAGLGLVAMIINLASKGTVRGIEYEPAYCNYANAVAQQLNLSNIEFITADARHADYSGANVFFMYTPFTGNMLQEMLNLIRAESQKHSIRIFTYGPCSAVVAMQQWLEPVGEAGQDLYTLYEFRSAAK